MTILNVDNLGKYFGARAVFRSVTFTVGQGERLAVVGRNGEGKTTLLRVIAKELEPDEGSFSIVGKRTMGYLSQDSPDFHSTVLGEVLSSHGEIAFLEGKLRELEEEMGGADSEQGSSRSTKEVMDEYARVTARFEALDGYSVEHRAKSILTGLGFTPDTFYKEANRLSGGERVRLSLAKLLLLEPDLLLLDEPTNHVDLMGVEWLEEFLFNYRGAVLMVSHDRYFLDRTAHKIIELEGGRARVYTGNYSQYLQQRETELRSQAEAYERQQELIKRTRAWIQRFKSNYNLVNTAKSREKMLERLDLIEKPKKEKRAMGIRFEEAGKSGDEALLLDSLSKGYPVLAEDGTKSGFRWLFRDFTYLVRRGERVALIGPNGCGKTTMLRCALGLDKDHEGDVLLGHGVSPGYFSQGLDDLCDDNTLLQEIRGLGLDNQEARDLLGRFLFSGEDVEKRVGNLSGGERNRLVLAKLVVGKSNFLFLDEPTNHLDMPSKEALEGALKDFPGAIMFASHDRFFIDKLATHLWIFDGGRVRVFKGSYSEYRKKTVAGEPIEFENERASFGIGLKKVSQGQENRGTGLLRPGASAGPSSGSRRADGGKRKDRDGRSSHGPRAGPSREVRPDQLRHKELKEIEERIIAAEEKRAEMLSLFSDPDSYSDAGSLPWKEFDELEKELQALYERWEALAEEPGVPGK